MKCQYSKSVQECIVTGQTAPTNADNSSYPTFHTYPAHVPVSGPSSVQCHMTTIHTALAQAPPSGNQNWKVSKQQSVHRYIPPHSMQPVPSPQMFYNNYSGGSITPSAVPPATSSPYEPFYYGTHPYYPGSYPSGNIYRHQAQTPALPAPSPPPPRPYLTITQFNYQPVGYPQVTQVPSQTSTANLVFGPPPRDRRCGADPQYSFCPYVVDRPASPRAVEHHKSICSNNVINDSNFLYGQSSKRTDLKPDSSASFEFAMPADQIITTLCEEKDLDCFHCQNLSDTTKVPEESLASNNYSTPKMWTECEFVDPMRIEDDELTKFIVDGCMKAENIAVRNQHRPCFKNIKHLCTRTRTDILKPRTTVANIHSQGIPWATKDFIFAFVRLINCWYILKGYLDDHEGSLGKIDQALTPEFKECYQKWQTVNKEMVKHLINIFVNLDTGISVQNAEIFSSFNQIRKIISTVSLPGEEIVNPMQENESKSCPTQLSTNLDLQEDKSGSTSPDDQQDEPNQLPNNIDSFIDDKLKCSEFDGKSVPGILRVKNMFNNSPVNVNTSEDETDSEKEGQVYMKPGSYRVPKKFTNTPVETPTNSDDESETSSEELNVDDEELWKRAIQCLHTVSMTQTVDSDSSNDSSDKDEPTESIINDDQVKGWFNSICETSPEEQVKEVEEKKTPRPLGRAKVSRRNAMLNKTFRKIMEIPEQQTSKLGESITPAMTSHKKSVSSMFFLSERSLGLSQICTVKFEKIIKVLWHQKFAKFITYDFNIVNVPDFNKYINNPMFLCNVMTNLRKSKYLHPSEVVHDLRLIVRNAEIYIKKRPDGSFEECLNSFSKVLESQLALEFSEIDFSSITGEPAQSPRIE